MRCGLPPLDADQHDRAHRHAFTAAATVDFDDDTRRLKLRPAHGPRPPL